jgi:inosine/xanthosine triphosphate pyrophosphatase family protein
MKRSKKYALKTIGLEGVLKLLEGVEDRRAYAEGALTYIEDEERSRCRR